MSRRSRLGRPLVGTLITIFLVFLVACGDDGGGGGASTVGVDLQEWSVIPAEESTSAGEVTFAIENKGEETHEFVVLKTDLGHRDLPTAEDGSVDEEGSGIEVVDEVEDLPSGESAELTVDLDSGSYVILCNIVEEEDGEPESHYQMGMSAEIVAE